MIILIGGVSCTGKTNMSQKLLEKYHIPYLSIDHIKMGLIRGNRYCDFKATDRDEEIAEKIWPIIKGIIKTNIENDQHLIIEGCYIPTTYKDDLEPEYLKHIISLYLGFSKQYIESQFNSSILTYKSVIEHKEMDEDYMNIDNFIKLHYEQAQLCGKNHMNYFEICESYEDEIIKIYEWIDEKTKAIRNLKFNI